MVGRRGGFAPARLYGVDIARGLALLGMFVAHVVRYDGELIVDGRSSILFATVAGVSLGLMTGGSTPPVGDDRTGLRLAVLVRGLLLIAIGVSLTAWLDPPIAVILDYYGFAFMLLVPLLFVGRAALTVITLVIVAVTPPLVAWATGLWDAGVFDPETQLPGLLLPVALWLVYGTYPMAVWLAFLLVGMLLARCDLRRWRTRAWAAAGGLVAALAGYLPVLGGADASAHSSTVFEVVGSGGVAVLVIALSTMVGDLPGLAGRVVRVVLYPLAAAGAMVLSLYVAHTVLLSIWYDRSAPYADAYEPWVLPALVIGALAIGTLWRIFIGSGPLEALFSWSTARLRGPRPPAARTAPTGRPAATRE